MDTSHAGSSSVTGYPVPPVGGVRTTWHQLPERVREAIEERLGSAVAQAVNQPGGFSPGLAARVVCVDGRRAFVKAVGASLNPDSPRIHRSEAAITRQLPGELPAPRLRASYDDGDWVALIFDEIDGRMPHLPWREDELVRVVDAVADLSLALTPSPVGDAPRVVDEISHEMLCYRQLAQAPPSDLDPWEQRHLEALAELAASSLQHLDGDTLVHLDIRADNVLMGERVWFVDWPWASRGAAWIDVIMLLINAVHHGHDPEPYLERHALTAAADPAHVTALLAGWCGYFAAHSRMPAPPGLPTLRAFQRSQHTTTLTWLRRRTGWA